MRLLIHHLTRMQKGFFCAAGVDLATGDEVRPLLKMGRLPVKLLRAHGGPFDMARVVELPTGIRWPTPPHLEDCQFTRGRTREGWTAQAGRFWNWLILLSKKRLRDIFGQELRHIGQSRYGTDAGKGRASLGVLLTGRNADLYTKPGSSGKLQVWMRLTDGEIHAAATVADIRLYQPDHVTPDPEKIDKAAHGIRASRFVILSLGLTRAHRGSPECGHRPIHWLQVNNIHLEADPTWQLGARERPWRWWPF